MAVDRVYTREEYLFRAKLAEQAELFQEMATAVKNIAETKVDLTIQERDMLAVAYKNLISPKRVAIATLKQFEEKLARRGDAEDRVKLTQELRETIELEQQVLCREVLALLDDHVLPSTSTAEGKVFFFKMKGDYNRYLTECTVEEARKEAIEGALQAYEAGSDIAKAELAVVNPILLGLALNFSVFYYEILKSPEKAFSHARSAYDEAYQALNSDDSTKSDEEAKKLVQTILELLRDNCNLWQSDIQANEENNV